MTRSLVLLLRLATARPWLTIVLTVALAGAALEYTRHALTFQTSSVRLLPPQRAYVQQFERYLQEFGELNHIVVVVESANPEQARGFAARLASELGQLPVRPARVTYRIDPDRFAGRALLYLSAEQLRRLRDTVAEHRHVLEEYAARPTLSQLITSVDREIVRRFAERFVDLGLGEPPRLDPSFIDTLLAAIAERVASPARGPSPWTAVLSGAHDDGAGYFTSPDQRLLFVLVEPRREDGNFTDNEEVIAGIRRTIATLRREYPGVTAGVTGTPALSNDEMLAALRDGTVATTLACVLTAGVVLLMLRRRRSALLMLGTLLVSLAWSLGLITLTVGHLSIFSVMFISLFVGLGVDYGIYLLFRYDEELGLAGAPWTALEATVRRAGPGVVVAALSAAATFASLTLTEFRGIVEFGFIGAMAILMALLAMLTLLPALLLALDRGPGRRPPASLAAAAGHRPGVPFLERAARHAWPILGAAVVLTAGSLWAATTVGFDYDRLNLQAATTESVLWERRILAAGGSAFPALASAETLDELRARQAAFTGLATVSDVVSVLKLIPADQSDKRVLLRELAPTVAHVRVAPAGPADPQALRAALAGLRARLGLVRREAGTHDVPIALRSAEDRSRRLLEHLEHGGADTQRRLDATQQEFRDDFAAKLGRLQANLDPGPLTVEDVPEELRRKFVGRTGSFLMRISPSVNTWNRDDLERFVADLRTVDAAVTGSPVISYEASRMMEKAYREGTAYAVALVLGLAAVMLRRARDTALAVVPILLGTLWTVGFMKLVGISFNLANVWALPLIVGAAAEYGLNVVLRHREALAEGAPVLGHSTVMAVLLNGLTTIAGFSSLMLARHQGIFSLGLLLTAGAVAGLVAALFVLPALLRLTFGAAPATTRAQTRLSLGRKGLCLVALAGLPVAPDLGHAAEREPTKRIQSAVDELHRLTTPAPAASPRERQERDAAAARVMNDLFDWTAMARQALQHHWEPRTSAERAEFTQLFAELFRRAYLGRISLVDTRAFRYLGETVDGDRAAVVTHVMTNRGSVIDVTYTLSRQAGTDWRVKDVFVEGISLIDSYRTQFASVIARSSYEALVQRLRTRVHERGASGPRATKPRRRQAA